MYRAVDLRAKRAYFLSWNRDVNATKSFLNGTMKNTCVRTKIPLVTDAALHRAG
jgi:hypothetical protein